MEFYEKLDFLMKLTGTTNSALALNTKLDPSHISRLRRGQRNALKNTTSIQSMAVYFARNCKEEYQRKALIEVLKIDPQTADFKEIADAIAVWLKEKKPDEIASVRNFIDLFSKYNAEKKVSESNCRENEDNIPCTTDVSVYYGVKGKRQAAIHFLTAVVEQKKPQTLLLFSDEATDWMTADKEFAAKWVCLMNRVLGNGNRIKIIHTVSRDLDEMLHAIHQWMPLYMTGLIEPFFYPKKRDGLFKRTLFISPGVAAVSSNSLRSSIERAANIFTKNDEVIRACTEEFNEFLRQCKPLLHVYTANEREAYFANLMAFEKENGRYLLKTESISLLTMPENAAQTILSRIEKADVDLKDLREQRKKQFLENVKENSYTEIIHVFDADQVKQGNIKVSFSEMLLGGATYYTLDEYIAHLEYLVKLLRENEHFHIHLIREIELNYMVIVKEDVGAIVAKTSSPPVALVIKENNLSAAFWGFLSHMVQENDYLYPDNEKTAEKLLDYIEHLKQC